MNDEREHRTSSSSAIAQPLSPKSETISSESAKFDKMISQLDRNEPPDTVYTATKLEKFWANVVVRWEILTTQFHASEFWIRWMMFRTRMYEAIVGAIAGFLADILAHPKLLDTMVNIIVAAINSFMDQDDIGTKFDKTAWNVIYDPDKARETSKALGKEVVPMVTSFVGGVASSLTPSAIMQRKKMRQESKMLRNSMCNTVPDIDCATPISEITLSERLDHPVPVPREGDKDRNDDYEDENQNSKRSNWLSNVKKLK